MIRIAMLIVMFAAPAFAQQPPDPASLQKAIVVLQQQRNVAMDQAAGVQVEAQRLTEENAKLKAEAGDYAKLKAELEDLKKMVTAGAK